MPYTLGQAAKATGKSKPTILQAITTNRLSAEKDNLNRWQIEESALFAIYPKLTEDKPVNKLVSNHDDLISLKARNEHLEELLKLHKEQCNHLNNQLIGNDEERQRLQNQCMQLTIVSSNALEQVRSVSRQLELSESERREIQGQLTTLLTYQPEKKIESENVAPTNNLFNKLFGRRGIKA